MLLQNASYRSINEKVEAPNVLMDVFEEERPNVVIHLAAQAGVRYSLENPRAYLESNINGTFELLEAAREYPPEHMLMASTSSAYGANEEMPYRETMKADQQISFYAATKKASENMAHSYSHLYNLPITMFRFFTVYGPWGRPDMALFKFTKAILEGNAIEIYNDGNLSRDFTYIDDLTRAIHLLISKIPAKTNCKQNRYYNQDSLSPVAPLRIVNIGNSRPVPLMAFVRAIERHSGVEAKKKIYANASWRCISHLGGNNNVKRVNWISANHRARSWSRKVFELVPRLLQNVAEKHKLKINAWK